MTSDVEKQVRTEIDDIERSAMRDQYRWKEYLDRLSDQGREKHLEILLERPIFERWLVLKSSLH